MSQSDELRALRASRPRSLFLRVSLLLFAGLLLSSWGLVDLDWDTIFAERRVRNLERFVGEVRPFPLQGQAWDWGVASHWAADLFDRHGRDAAVSTLAISVLAIVLAAAVGLALAFPAARTFAAPEPYLPEGKPPSRARQALWRGLTGGVRGVLILLRSLPEYVWAFLILGLLGPSAWTAVLALAIHNSGILARLTAETIENVDARPAEALRELGAGRSQIALAALLPDILPRFLLYFFYRWETCVREATVLGLLGIVSLGYWVEDARTRGQYDTLIFMVLLGALIVIFGDLVSTLVRRAVRRA